MGGKESSRFRISKMCIKIFGIGPQKGKGKVPRWGPSALQPSAYCTLNPNEFLHSSLEALHTKRRERPQLAKEGTIDGI
jgi:hypothetical protein